MVRKKVKKPAKRPGYGSRSNEASRRDLFGSASPGNNAIGQMEMSETDKKAKVQFYLEQMRQAATEKVYKSVYEYYRQDDSKSLKTKNATEKKVSNNSAIEAANRNLEKQKLILGNPQIGARTTLMYPEHPPLMPREVNVYGYMTTIDCNEELAKKAKRFKLAARKKELQKLEDEKAASKKINEKEDAAEDEVIPETSDEEDDLGIEFEKVAVSVAEAEDQAAKKLLASPEKVAELGAQSFLDRTLNDKKSQRISQLVEQLFDELIVKRQNVQRGKGHKELNLRSRIQCQLELLTGREKLEELRAAKEKGETDLSGQSIREEIIKIRMSQTELGLNFKRSVEMYKVLSEHVEKREQEYRTFLEACNYAEDRPVKEYSTRTRRWASADEMRDFP